MFTSAQSAWFLYNSAQLRDLSWSVLSYLHASVVLTRPAARGVIAELRNIVTISSLTALERILYAATMSALKQRFITYTFLPMNYSRVRTPGAYWNFRASISIRIWMDRPNGGQCWLKYYHLPAIWVSGIALTLMTVLVRWQRTRLFNVRRLRADSVTVNREVSWKSKIKIKGTSTCERIPSGNSALGTFAQVLAIKTVSARSSSLRELDGNFSAQEKSSGFIDAWPE
jgi:hypothetical protein